MTDFETWWKEQTVNQSSELFPAYIKAIAKMAWEAGQTHARLLTKDRERD